MYTPFTTYLCNQAAARWLNPGFHHYRNNIMQLNLNSSEFMEGEGGATQLKLVWKADEGKKAIGQVRTENFLLAILRFTNFLVGYEHRALLLHTTQSKSDSHMHDNLSDDG